MNRTCSKCKQEKPATLEFFRWRKDRNKFYSSCKECEIRDGRKRYHTHPEKYNARSRTCRAAANTEVKEAEAVTKKAWDKANPERVRAIQKRKDEKHRIDPFHKLNRNMRHGMRKSLKYVGSSKNERHWETLVDFDRTQLKEHLEAQFSEGMNWDNHGKNGWHVDHIRPIASFNYKTTDDSDFKECWCLTNFQPLWEAENCSQGAKWDDPCVI